MWPQTVDDTFSTTISFLETYIELASLVDWKLTTGSEANSWLEVREKAHACLQPSPLLAFGLETYVTRRQDGARTARWRAAQAGCHTATGPPRLLLPRSGILQAPSFILRRSGFLCSFSQMGWIGCIGYLGGVRG